MSRPSTAQSSKNPPVPRPSAWSKGPPTSAPSRSQSPAPATPVFPTHSRRPSALAGVSIKDGVTVNRNNAGAAKHGSAVTFGSIDDVSAPISSSPAAAPAIKSESVKSFGTIDADTHVNGKSTLSARPSVAAPVSTASSSASSPAVSVASPALKLARTDIAKLFQNPSSAPSSQPPSDTSSPSLRSSGLPSSQHPTSSQPSQSSVPPQPSQLSSHSSFIQYRHPPSNVGSGPSRSPAFPPRQSANGSGPRPPGGPNGAPSQINTGMPSPRLGPMPHNGQSAGMPPPSQMQVGQQVPVAWHSGYYYPTPDTYVGYPSHHQTWYQPPHHIPSGPHGPPHTGMPISPRNPTIPLQPGSGTPTLSHAVANPIHSPHPPPPLAHPSASMGSISTPPPTPSTNTSRLNANSSTFAPRPKVTLKTADGTEVAIADLSSKTSASPSPANNASTNGQGTFRQGSPANSNANRPSVRLETEDQQRRRLAEEERAKAEVENKARREKEAEERKKREQEELKRKEEEAKRKEEEAKKKKEQEEKERIRKEAEEKERLRKEEEERIRKEAEEKERLRKEEEERERIRLEEAEKERKRKEEEEKERIRKEENERIREEENERIRKEEKERILKEEEERQRKEEERKCKEEEEERERLRKEEEEEKERQRQEAEKASRAKELEKEAELSKEEGEVDALELHDTVPSPQADLDKKFKEPLRINTSEPRRRPGPLDLSNAGPVSAAPRSAVATARVIDDLSRVSYPEGISSPNPDLNANAKDGKFRYDRDFLLQFMAICKEKPDMLPPLDAIGLEPIDQASLAMTRGGSGRHRQASGPSAVQRGNSIGLGFGPPSTFNKSSGLNPFAAGGMGNFSTAKLTSDERFQMSSNRSASVGGTGSMNFSGRPVAMQRTPSQGGPGGVSSNRTRSQRGKQRDKMTVQQAANAHAAQVANFEPVAPLKVSENRWDRKALHVEGDSPDVVDRKVRGLLNKLTMERFDSISDQIIEWANKSEKEKDGRTLIQVIRLVFEKATDEATWSEMYARLCRKMMEQISTNVQDDGIRNSEGKPIAGGQLFRKYLLNRCQEDFERGWVTKEATAAAAATKAMEDQAIKAANEKGGAGEDEEVALYSEEYYAAQKAKRQGLGLIKFIGELFKLQMLTERIMHECVKKLLGNVNNPEEEEIESLCKLLTTVGQILDTQKAHGHMDVYFKRMRELAESTNVSHRMQFMLQDILELRSRKWVARNTVAAPATIAQIHEAAAKEKAAQEKEFSQRQMSMSRGGSRRGGDRGDQLPANPEGWAVAGNTARPPSKVDLSNFGKINKAPPTTFGPGSVFAGKKDKRESLSRTNSSSNMFSMLQNAESVADKASEAPLQRRKLALLPRTKPIENETQQQESDEEASSPAAPAEMSDEAAKKKIDEDCKELFGVRNLGEAEVYFSALPAQHHHKLVDKLVSTAVESKEADAQLVSDLFGVAASKNLCSSAAFEEGLESTAEIIEDIAIDAPKAFELFAIMVRGASLDEERRTRLASKSEASEKLLLLLS